MSLRCRFGGVLAVLCLAAQPLAAQNQAPVAAAAPPVGEYRQQFLVPGSHFHGVHGLAFNKEDVYLTRYVNRLLADLKADGEWKAIYNRWLAAPLGPAPAPPAAVYGRGG